MSYMRNLRVTTEQTVEGFTVPKNSHAMANLTKFMKVKIMIWPDILPFFLACRTLSIGSILMSSGIQFTLSYVPNVVIEALLLICIHFLVGLSGF